MNKRKSKVVNKVLVLCLMSIVLISQTNCDGDKKQVEEMQQAIAKHLPVGSTEAEVLTFLEDRRISHSELVEYNGSDKYFRPGLQRVITASVTNKWLGSERSKLYIVLF